MPKFQHANVGMNNLLALWSMPWMPRKWDPNHHMQWRRTNLTSRHGEQYSYSEEQNSYSGNSATTMRKTFFHRVSKLYRALRH
jgi:hypothetical protein